MAIISATSLFAAFLLGAPLIWNVYASPILDKPTVAPSWLMEPRSAGCTRGVGSNAEAFEALYQQPPDQEFHAGVGSSFGNAVPVGCLDIPKC